MATIAEGTRPRYERIRPFLLIPLLLVVAVGCSGDGAVDAAAACARCNVLLVSLDTLRADHLGAYGYERETSPHLDAIAERSVVFENAYVQAGWTLPSHYSIFTGLYPSRHQVVHTSSKPSEDLPSLVETFLEHGYETAAFTGGGYMRARWGHKGFNTYREEDAGIVASWPEYRTSMRSALDWVDSAEEPFFLLWHTYAPHAAYVPEERFDLFSDPEYRGAVDPVPGRNVEVCGEKPPRPCVRKQVGYYIRLREMGLLDEADYRQLIAKYDGVVRSVDDLVGEIWRRLESSGRLENTIVVITSDHGESFPREGVDRPAGHPSPYREVVRVPWIMWLPRHGHDEIEDVVETIDILPTIIGAVGLSKPVGIDGHDVLAGDESDFPGVAVTEHWLAKKERLAALSLVWRRWHLIRWHDGRAHPVELYDMQVDPDERHDLSARNGQMLARLQRMADRWSEVIGSRLVTGSEEMELDRETREELEALGYL